MSGKRGDDTTILGSDPQGPLRWVLLIAGDGRLRREVLPDRGVMTLGRDEGCDIVLPHAAISKRHAKVEIGDPLRLTDLGSKNGTRLGGTPVSGTVELHAHEVFEIGPVTLVLNRGADHEPPLAEAEEPLVADPAMEQLYDLVDSIAPSDLSVIIVGETGTGKEMVAARVHRRSRRSTGPLVRLNCAALPLSLFEAELFGHDEGAFTGATGSKPGLVEQAGGGTFFLDEIGEMPAEAQAKVLRAIEDQAFYRVGGRTPVHVDVRFVAATNRDLVQAVQQGSFRADLFHRLNGITLRVPALRERPAEIIPLAQRFAHEAAASAAMQAAPRLSAATEEALRRHPWLGNVRELRNSMQRAVLLARGKPIEPEHLHLDDGAGRSAVPQPETLVPPPPTTPAEPTDLRTELQALEQQRIIEALEACAGNQTRAAAQLGISRRTLISRLEAYGIARPSKGPAGSPDGGNR